MKLKRLLYTSVLIISMVIPSAMIGTQTVAAAGCDQAQFIADVTIPDGTIVAPGAPMAKTWRLKNIGTCTWSTAYAIVFYSGSPMGAPSVVYMPYSVVPGATVDITVNMIAPTTPGHYRSYWMLRNASSTLFGVGPTGTWSFFIDIVVSPTSYAPAYDFVANYCSATWSSGAGALACPGVDGNPLGYVIKSTSPQLENGTIDTSPGLFVGPQNVTDGYIAGMYPAFLVQTGDRFKATVSCAYGVTSCYVNFRLEYQIGAGPIQTLWSFKEKTEGNFYRANVDLSSLAGQNVKFILKVTAYGSPVGDRALWGGAHIARLGGVVPPPPVTTCDKAALVADITIPDGTTVISGTSFVKTWRLQNVGTCPWTTDYKIVFAGGSSLGASATSYNLLMAVPVGGTIDVSISMAAPATAGSYSGFWKLRNASGVDFGVGASGTDAIDVIINVPTIVGPHADLSVTITDGAAGYTPGATTTYTIQVTNHGPQNITGGAFSVTKPLAVTTWSVSCVPDAGATCTLGPVASVTNISDTVDIPAGKKVIYTVVATISASAVGNLVTTAGITNPVAVPDPVLTNNSATDTDSPPSADLSVTKTDGIGVYTPGGSTTYTITVTNNGPLNMTGGTFTDPKPTQVTTWTWTCVPDPGASCAAGPVTTAGNYSDTVSIPAGKKVIYTAVATISPAATGNLVNTATITSPVSMPDPLPANNTATDTDTGPSADLSITKTDGVTWYTPGGTLTYTIRVSNSGPQAVLGAAFADNIPAQITTWTWTCVADLGALCTAGPTVIATNYTDTVSIPAGLGVTYTVVATVSPAATGNLVNTATITSPVTIPDPIPANNSVSDTDAPPSADLSVTKSDGITIYPQGGNLTYTIVVRNNGPADVVGAVVSDALPAQIDSWIWTCVADTGAVCTPGPVTPGGAFVDVVDIPAGKKVTYSVVASVNIAATGTMTNIFTVTPPATIPDPTPGNNSATDTDEQPSADLRVTKTDMVVVYIPGGTVIYTIEVRNLGPSAVTGVTFTDNIPPQITNWTWTCTPELGAACTVGPTALGGNFIDAIDLPVGKKVTYTVVANISLAAVGPMVNTATITSPALIPDPFPPDNSATDIDVP